MARRMQGEGTRESPASAEGLQRERDADARGEGGARQQEWRAEGAECRALRSSVFQQRYTRDGKACVQPFNYKGVAFDDCRSSPPLQQPPHA
jgi:hypothetical protein